MKKSKKANNTIPFPDEINKQLEKDIDSFGNCKTVAIVFVGKVCKYFSLK